MLRKNILIFVTVFVLAMTAYYFLMRKAPETVTIPSYLEQTTEEMWKPYKDPSGHFQVLFPVDPDHASSTQPFTSPTEQVVYHIYSAEGFDKTKYMLSLATYPDSADMSNSSLLLQTLLEQMANGSRHNDIIGREFVTFQNYPAMDFDLQNLEFATLGRAIIVNKTLYVLLVMNQDRDFLEKHFHTFADSLTIVKK